MSNQNSDLFLIISSKELKQSSDKEKKEHQLN